MRRFLLFIAICVLTTAGRAQTTITRTLLGPADFVYVGAFTLPAFVGAADARWGRTLTHRYVDGQLRLMTMAVNGTVYEVAVPALTQASPYAEAPVVRVWGDVTLGKRWTDRFGLNSGFIYGLYWDATDQRLYWSYGDTYNTTSPDDPSIGYSTLDDTTGIATAAGVWRFTGRGSKMTMAGVTPIPAWFADAYTGGRRLGAGFGGYWSIVATGPASMGPAFAAFAPPNLEGTPDRGSLAFVPLVGYPYNGQPYTEPDRAHRDTDYTNEFDFWNPRDGVGYWSWTDWLWQSGVWIDTPNKTGLVFFPTFGNGRTWYENSTLNAERSSHWAYVYSPADLALVAQGQLQQWQVQPALRWPMQFPALSYPLPGWADEPWQMVTGVTFDAVTNRLYVAVRFASEGGVVTSSTQAMVFVYQIADDGTQGTPLPLPDPRPIPAPSPAPVPTPGPSPSPTPTPSPSPAPMPSPHAPLALTAVPASVTVGSTYVVSFAWIASAVQNVTLDGAAPPARCVENRCSGVVIEDAVAPGPVVHTISGSDAVTGERRSAAVVVSVVAAQNPHGLPSFVVAR